MRRFLTILAILFGVGCLVIFLVMWRIITNKALLLFYTAGLLFLPYYFSRKFVEHIQTEAAQELYDCRKEKEDLKDEIEKRISDATEKVQGSKKTYQEENKNLKNKLRTAGIEIEKLKRDAKAKEGHIKRDMKHKGG